MGMGNEGMRLLAMWVEPEIDLREIETVISDFERDV